MFRRTLALSVTIAASLSLGADLVTLRAGGVRITVERVEPDGDGLWLYSANGNIQRLPASAIASIQPIKPPGAAPAAEETAPTPVVRPAFRSTHSDATRRMIDEAAWRHGLPPAIVHAVAQAESAYNQSAVSPVGAIGVMQLMPYTAAALGANPRDKAQNIDAGTRYLREMLVKFQNNPDQVALALAAYNAGPGAVDRYRGVPPYAETRTYVRRVIGKYEKMAGPEALEAPAAGTPGVAAQPEGAAMAAAVANVPVPRVDKPTVAGLD